MTPAVTVIVPAINAGKTIHGTLDAIAAQALDRPFEVIVAVDDDSRDDTVAIAHRHPVCREVLHGRGLGPGAKRNLGATAAKAPVLAFTDADCFPTPDWLVRGLDAIRNLDIVQGAVLPAPGQPLGPFDRSLGVVSDYGLYETANLFVRTDTFTNLGGFEDLLIAGDRPFGEDAVFVWRARRLGARVGFDRTAVVHHAIFPGTRGDYLKERARRRYFPQLVRLIPELRKAFLFESVFLSSRTAAFDTALAAVLVTAKTRSLLPLLMALPYVVELLDELQRWRGSPSVGTLELAWATIAADMVSCAALAFGSVTARTPVL
jgi:glycosyltransferase involved in cell wall biosynthesis